MKREAPARKSYRGSRDVVQFLDWGEVGESRQREALENSNKAITVCGCERGGHGGGGGKSNPPVGRRREFWCNTNQRGSGRGEEEGHGMKPSIGEK